MAASLLSALEATATRCDTPESSLATDAASSNAQSSSSTPPTSVADSTGVPSPSVKLDVPVLSIFDHGVPSVDDGDDDDHSDEEQVSSTGRPLRRRKSTLNPLEYELSTSALASAKKARSERGGSVTRRRTVSGETLVGGNVDAVSFYVEKARKETEELAGSGIEALDLQLPVKKVTKVRKTKSLGTMGSAEKKKGRAAKEVGRRKSLRTLNQPIEQSISQKLSVLGKRGRGAIQETAVKITRELRRLADTNEFAKIETKPVLHEVWSCGKLVTGNEPPKKKVKTEAPKEKAKEDESEEVEEEKPKVKEVKKWLSRGLYAGQEAIVDLSHKYTTKERRAMIKASAEVKRRSILPLPLWAGQRLLLNGRDFKLPFDICNPLPPGQPKPDEWRKTTKSKLSTICKAK